MTTSSNDIAQSVLQDFDMKYFSSPKVAYQEMDEGGSSQRKSVKIACILDP